MSDDISIRISIGIERMKAFILCCLLCWLPLQAHSLLAHNKQSRSLVQPPGASCVLNETLSYSSPRRPSKFKLNPNNSIQIISPASQPDESSQQQQMVIFETICGGWQNSVSSSDGKSSQAFWLLDKSRGALVAKFIYHNRFDHPEAKLTSPIFPPIPLYHSMSDSKYYQSCRLTFRLYSTIASQIEVALAPIPTVVAGSGQSSSLSLAAESADLSLEVEGHPADSHERLDSYSFSQGDLMRSKQEAEKFGEPAFWREYKIILPPGSSNKNRPNPSPQLYKLEFSAIPSKVSSAETNAANYLVGIALANISLAPECFGLHIDEEELVKSGYFEQREFLSAWNESQNQSLIVYFGRWIVEHRLSELLFVVFIVVVIIATVQHLYCAFKKSNGNRDRPTLNGGARMVRSAQQQSPLWRRIICPCSPAHRSNANNCRSGASSIRGIMRPGSGNSSNRKRIYAVDNQLNNHTASSMLPSYVNLANMSEAEKARYQREQQIRQRHHLHPLSLSLIENVELKENPHYASLAHQEEGRQQQHEQYQQRYEGGAAQSSLTWPRDRSSESSLFDADDVVQYEPDEWEVDIDRVILGEQIGTGAFGMVYLGELRTENEPTKRCAIKTLPKTATLKQRIDFLREASIMKQFNTFHVVRLMGMVSTTNPVYVIMEYMKHGDLKSYLMKMRERRGMVLVDGIYLMAAQIADGMAYLASKKFVHRDLAARNCMVGENGAVKVGDFGLAREIYENEYFRTGSQGPMPVRWMAPESLLDRVFTSASDVWSYGIVVWEIVNLGVVPYNDLSHDQVIHRVLAGFKMSRPEHCPDKLYNIMKQCWERKQEERPTFLSLVETLLPETENKLYPNCFYPGPALFDDEEETRPIRFASELDSSSRAESFPAISDDRKPLVALYPVVH